MTTGPVRVAAWSGPRNLSTAMMRSWENRADCIVIDEPLYAASLAVTGGDHPMRDDILAAGPTDPDQAIAACLAPLPEGITVHYQKHIAHHLHRDFDRSWLDELEHILLLRDPRRVLASYTKVWEDVSVETIGLPQQLELLPRAAIVVDTSDFLTDPGAYLAEMCLRLGIEFDEAMLEWPPGPRDSDGVWAPAWYDNVIASTGFGPPPASETITLPERLESVAVEAMDIYRVLAAEKLVLS